MLTYEFMRIAFLAAILLGIAIPLVGSTAVFKRLSSSGDAMAHASLAGVAIGLAAGLAPLAVSIISCIIAFLIIELLRKKFSKFSEIGVTVVLAASVAIAGIVSSYTSSYSFESYLFGSILLISDAELYVCIGLAAVCLIFSVVFYRQIFALLYSESEAKVAGVKVNLLNFLMDLLLAITIAVGAKIVGSMVVSCLMVLPTAIALQLKKGYLFTMVSSVIFSVASMAIGLTIAYYADWRPGASIVMVALCFLFLCMLYRGLLYLLKRRRSQDKQKAE